VNLLCFYNNWYIYIYTYMVHGIRYYDHGIKDNLLKAFCMNIRCVACPPVSAKSVVSLSSIKHSGVFNLIVLWPNNLVLVQNVVLGIIIIFLAN